jgi:hypothetical protein
VERQDNTQADQVERVVQAVAGEVRALAEWLVEHRTADLREQEQGLVERGHRLLTRLLGEVLAERERETSRGGAWCPQCGEVGVWLRGRRKTLHLLVGDVPLVRDCGYCGRCQATWAPLDTQLGVDQSGRSPRLVEALALVGAELAFSPAAERLGQLCGVWLSASQAETVTEAVGLTLAAQQEATAVAALTEPDAPDAEGEPDLAAAEATLPWLIITLDGVLVRQRTGYHEVKVAAIARAGPALDPAAGRQPRLGRWRSVVETSSLERFGQQVWYQAQRLGAATVERVVVLGDGAAWIWNLADLHFPGVVRVLDYWHAVQHLWALGTARFGEDDRRLAAWVGRAQARLRDGGISSLLIGWAKVEPANAPAFAEELTYFRNQAPKMEYGTARAAGLPIGSGAVESANRPVVGIRAKQAGMRWSEPGLRGVLTLRALLRSGCWAAWWETQPLPIKLTA